MQRQYDHDHLVRVHVRRALDLLPPAADEDSRLARLAYITYGACVGGVNHRGEPLPRWDDMSGHQRAAWEGAAMAVSMAARLPDAPGWLVPAAEVRVDVETREAEPTPDGWRVEEPTGVVVVTITGPAAEVREMLGRLGV